jgi:hypothetical protein
MDAVYLQAEVIYTSRRAVCAAEDARAKEVGLTE